MTEESEGKFIPLFADPADKWNDWFAWYPVNTVNSGWTWLRPVRYRLCVYHHWLGNCIANTTFFQYKRNT